MPDGAGWIPRDPTSPSNARIYTESREDNRSVLLLAKLLSDALTDGSIKSRKEAEHFLEAVVIDFNCRTATTGELRRWTELLDTLCSKACRINGLNGLQIITRGLFHQLRYFHDELEYKDYGESTARKLIVGGEIFNNKQALKSRLIQVVKSATIGVQLNPNSSEFRLIRDVLEFHPNKESKLSDLASICIERNPKSEALALVLIKSDGSRDMTSFGKCLPHIPDPTQDPIRNSIVQQIFQFYQFYKSTHAATLIQAAEQRFPPTEFNKENGRFVNAQAVNESVQSYLKGMLELLKFTVASPVRQGHPGVSLTSLECTTIHWDLKRIVFEKLHIMELERDDMDADDFDPDLFNIWLRDEVRKLVAVISDKAGKYSEVEKAEARRLAQDPKSMRSLYDQLRTELDVSPVLVKLDEAFSNVAVYIIEEMQSVMPLKVRYSTVAKHYGDLVAQRGERGEMGGDEASSDFSSMSNGPRNRETLGDQESATSGGSSDAGSKTSGIWPEPTRPLGLMSEASSSEGSGSMQSGSIQSASGKRNRRKKDGWRGDRENNRMVELSEVFFERYLKIFRKHCLLSTESPVLPLLFFVLSNQNAGPFHTKLFECIFECAESELDPENKVNMYSFVISLCCRAARLSVSMMEGAMLRLLNPVRQASKAIEKLRLATPRSRSGGNYPLRQSLPLSSALFQGCLEIISVRWSVLHDEAELESIIRIVCHLSLCDNAYGNSLVSETAPIVCRLAAHRLSDLDFGADGFFHDFLQRLKERGKARSTAKVWPRRPFDKTDLHRLQGYVHKSEDWYDWDIEKMVSDIQEGSAAKQTNAVVISPDLVSRIMDKINSTLETEDSQPRPPAAAPDTQEPQLHRGNKDGQALHVNTLFGGNGTQTESREDRRISGLSPIEDGTMVKEGVIDTQDTLATLEEEEHLPTRAVPDVQRRVSSSSISDFAPDDEFDEEIVDPSALPESPADPNRESVMEVRLLPGNDLSQVELQFDEQAENTLQMAEDELTQVVPMEVEEPKTPILPRKTLFSFPSPESEKVEETTSPRSTATAGSHDRQNAEGDESNVPPSDPNWEATYIAEDVDEGSNTQIYTAPETSPSALIMTTSDDEGLHSYERLASRDVLSESGSGSPVPDTQDIVALEDCLVQSEAAGEVGERKQQLDERSHPKGFDPQESGVGPRTVRKKARNGRSCGRRSSSACLVSDSSPSVSPAPKREKVVVMKPDGELLERLIRTNELIANCLAKLVGSTGPIPASLSSSPQSRQWSGRLHCRRSRRSLSPIYIAPAVHNITSAEESQEVEARPAKRRKTVRYAPQLLCREEQIIVDVPIATRLESASSSTALPHCDAPQEFDPDSHGRDVSEVASLAVQSVPPPVLTLPIESVKERFAKGSGADEAVDKRLHSDSSHKSRKEKRKKASKAEKDLSKRERRRREEKTSAETSKNGQEEFVRKKKRRNDSSAVAVPDISPVPSSSRRLTAMRVLKRGKVTKEDLQIRTPMSPNRDRATPRYLRSATSWQGGSFDAKMNFMQSLFQAPSWPELKYENGILKGAKNMVSGLTSPSRRKGTKDILLELEHEANEYNDRFQSSFRASSS